MFKKRIPELAPVVGFSYHAGVYTINNTIR